MFFLTYITLIYVWVDFVSSRYMREWSFSDEMIAHLFAMVVFAAVAHAVKAWYMRTNHKYYDRVTRRNYKRAVRRVVKQERKLVAKSFKLAGNKPLGELPGGTWGNEWANAQMVRNWATGEPRPTS